MRSMWLLPDRRQTGSIKAVDDDGAHNLHEIINLNELPPEFVLGIPEEIYRSKSNKNFLFAQFAFLRTGTSVFCLSAPAGKDISGRVVSISNLQFLERGEVPCLEPSPPSIVDEENRSIINTAFSNQKETDADLFRSVKIMLGAVRQEKNARTFSNETLVVARNKPDWMPQKKRLGLSEMTPKRFSWIVISIILLLISCFILL